MLLVLEPVPLVLLLRVRPLRWAAVDDVLLGVVVLIVLVSLGLPGVMPGIAPDGFCGDGMEEGIDPGGVIDPCGIVEPCGMDEPGMDDPGIEEPGIDELELDGALWAPAVPPAEPPPAVWAMARVGMLASNASVRDVRIGISSHPVIPHQRTTHRNGLAQSDVGRAIGAAGRRAIVADRG